jgi:hypothetical protein
MVCARGVSIVNGILKTQGDQNQRDESKSKLSEGNCAETEPDDQSGQLHLYHRCAVVRSVNARDQAALGIVRDVVILAVYFGDTRWLKSFVDSQCPVSDARALVELRRYWW